MTAAKRLKLAVRIAAPGWRRTLKGLAATAKTAGAAAHEAGLADKAAALTGEVTLVFADDSAMQGLNAQFRGKDKPTNVLSFPDRNGGGDIMLALETIAAEAAAQGKTPGDHTTHLIVHGILHLMGYDHLTQRDANRMERVERAVLARFGIADPYVLKGTRSRP